MRSRILVRSALLVALALQLIPRGALSQVATVKESTQVFRTYPFGDPDPVARMSNIYPYFRFEGYSITPVDREWKIVTLENPYIKVLIAPEMGGKVLGAFEKSTGKAFIYFNRVIKFREIAMRGPWTSGGLEFNFGDIGHTPTTATPVDYVTRTNEDGSVSCIIGAMDLPSRTEWRVDIQLPKDKAYFETHSFWYNPTELNTSLYHWMCAAADADSDLRFIYPGTSYIDHGGGAYPWPVDNAAREISQYAENAFGSSKSYHVLGVYTDTYAAYWANDDFGVVHWSPYTDKPGKKIWIWALSREGEIWKDLLTDRELGELAKARGLLEKVASYSQEHGTDWGGLRLIGALALRELGRDADATKLIDEWTRREPKNLAARWSAHVVAKRRAAMRKAEEEIRKGFLGILISKSAIDSNLALIVELNGILEL